MINNDEKVLKILTNIQEDISALKNDITELKDGFSELNEGVAGLKDIVARMREGVSELRIGQLLIEKEIKETNGRLAALENSVTRMENETGKKLDSLYDSHVMLYDISKEVRVDIADLKTTVEKHDLQIRFLTAKHAITA